MHIHLVTSYHFPRSETVAFDRLLRSVRASLSELGDRGRLILVPSGSNAARAEEVLSEFPCTDHERLIFCDRQDPSSNVIALNAGVATSQRQRASPAAWIGSVESSAVVKPGWLNALLALSEDQPDADALFGRLVSETDDRRIWADGHTLVQGRTFNIHEDGSPCRLPRTPFPCLSAALFSRRLVTSVLSRYGDFVCASLCHYGNCTDVALRSVEVGCGMFAFTEKAVALKRWPLVAPDKAAASQILAATRHYSRRRDVAFERVAKKHGHPFAEAADALASTRLKQRYSPHTNRAPRASIDESVAWRTATGNRRRA